MCSKYVECNVPESLRISLNYSHTGACVLFSSLYGRRHDGQPMFYVCWSSFACFSFKPKFLLVVLGLSCVYIVSCKTRDCTLNMYKDERSQELTSEIWYCFCVDRLGDVWKCKVAGYREGSNLCLGLFRFRGYRILRIRDFTTAGT